MLDFFVSHFSSAYNEVVYAIQLSLHHAGTKTRTHYRVGPEQGRMSDEREF